MKVLICGGRTFDDYDKVCEVLDPLAPDITMVIQGGAKGADSLAARWATEQCIHVAEVKPLWDAFGKSAGFRRNSAMLQLQPDLVIAFPGGTGTRNMVMLARAEDLNVMEIIDY